MIPQLLALFLALATPAATADRPVAFPETPAGRHARDYFTAFAAGDDAMRRYVQAHVSAEGLARRGVEDRIAVYREMREEHGVLTPERVVGGEATELEVIARAERGGRLSITFLCEPAPTHALLGLRVMDMEAHGDDTPGSGSGASGPRPGHGEGLRAESPAGPPLSEVEAVKALRAYVDSLSRADAFSGAVLLARGERVLLRHAWGLASRQGRKPNRVETRFNLGSINKAFTQTAIHQLAARGALRLTDTVARWLPELPAEKARRLTIQHLLDHRGGTGDIFNARYAAMDPSRVRSLTDWMEIIRDQPLEFEPGSRQKYSNAGYVLLGAIVEKASGQSYEHYVREHVYKPAGMTSTGHLMRDEPAERAIGYTRRSASEAWRENTAGMPGRGSPAGGGYSTVDDLRRFAEAMRAGRLGAPGQSLGIAGGAPGINAALVMPGDYTLVVLANLDPPAAERIATRGRGLLRRAGPEPDARMETPAVDAAAGGGAGSERRLVRGGPEDSHRRPRRSHIPEGGATVAMHKSAHLPTVDVLVNGQGPFRFAIDTGAGGTARIDSALADRLGLATVGEAMGGDPSGLNRRRVRLVAVDAISVGNARFEGLVAGVSGGSERRLELGIDGILGFGLFADGLLTLDYPAAQVKIERGELPAADGATVLEFEYDHGIPQVPIEVAGNRMVAHVDAGAPGAISLPLSMADKLPLAAPPVVIGRGRTVSNTFEIRSAELEGEARIGGYTLSSPRLDFQPIFQVANVGARLLRDYAVTFDQKNRRMRLLPGGPAAAGERP